MNKVELAAEKFIGGYNCAQAVLFASSNDEDIEKNTALKLSWGFGAGMGRKQEVCGAITGGIIAIGLKYGNFNTDQKSVTEEVYSRTRQLMDKFKSKNGTYLCSELLNCNLMTDEGRKFFNDNNLKDTICKKCVKDVVQILEENY